MKAYILTDETLATIKATLRELKKEQRRLYKKISNGMDDPFDNTELDGINGKIAGIEFTLGMIIGEKEA